MKGFSGRLPFIRMYVLVTGIILLFSCSNESDMREATKAQLGEPDLVQSGGSGPYQYQVYVYARKDINRVYEYRKSAPGCGGQGQWYVNQVYPADYLGYTLYTPPTIVHTTVKTGEPGKNLLISAKVTDDGQVVSVILFYRKPGATDYQPITMNPESDSSVAEIPADQVTTAGIQYYIEATDNGQHKSRLPVQDFYTVTIKEAGAARIIGQPETTETFK
ncbi:MAG: hypothetical protein Q8O92_13375 [Candidatus Latescibacter sp.]|nr:hypothetical protein [Candidatus Latescibacter sp.]